jgi:hypothetical protein
MPISDRLLLYAAVVIAIGVIGAALRRLRQVLRMADRLTVLLVDMTAQLGGTPNAFQILEQIIAQFRTDSGSSLRDQINGLTHAVAGLTEAARRNEQAAAVLEGNVETVRELAAIARRQDGEDRARMMKLLQYLEASVAASGLRIEDVAKGLEEIPPPNSRRD